MNAKKVAYWVIALVVIFAVARLFDKYDARLRPGEPSMSRLKAEFSAIPIPVTDVATGSVATFNRGGAVGVIGHYETSSPVGSVVDYYREQLSSKGWGLSSIGKVNLREFVIRFCKDGISVTVDAQDGGASTRYYLGVVWTNLPSNSTYCPSRVRARMIV